jgi:hypothetical protein
MLIAMSHQSITDMAELRKMADSYIRNELIRLEGIAEVSLSGEERQVLTIETDPIPSVPSASPWRRLLPGSNPITRAYRGAG